jgi:phosphodiesterase/alkaline phosphatase D-like protein
MLALVGANAPASGAAEPTEFPYGVGASDVKPTSALLWTQTTASQVDLQLSTDPSFTSGVQTKHVTVDPAHDGTVLVLRKNLTPGTRYYYLFRDPAADQSSRLGTFETAPSAGTDQDVTFAYSGDQDGTINEDTGLPAFNSFEVFGQVLAENPDFYLNIGDTIYSDSDFLDHPAATLDEYRALYKQNLTYDSLRNLRAATPFYTIWDDHEVRNDFDRATVDPALFANGSQAFEEYNGMNPPSAGTGYYRHFRWGSEAEVFVLDERSFRSTEADRLDTDGDTVLDCTNPITHGPDLAPGLAQSVRNIFGSQLPASGLGAPVAQQCLDDLKMSGRTMLGSTQRKVFLRDLKASTATFKLIVNEDPMMQLYALPYDRWEGFQWERNLILKNIDNNDINNVVWLTTDHHANLAHTVDYNSPNPGSHDTVQGMFDYAVGPVATFTFAEEINRAVGPGTSNLVRKFLLLFNENTCAQLGNPAAPHNYTYGLVHIDSATHTISITPKDQNGDSVAGNGVVGTGGDPQCYSYEATAV